MTVSCLNAQAVASLTLRSTSSRRSFKLGKAYSKSWRPIAESAKEPSRRAAYSRTSASSDFRSSEVIGRISASIIMSAVSLFKCHQRSTYLMMHEFIQCSKGITNERGVKLLYHKNLSELNHSSVKDGNCNLHRVHFTRHGILKVWVSHLKRFVYNVMFV